MYNNQSYFMEMMEKMNNLSFQILEEIKEIKEKKNSSSAQNFNKKNNTYNNINVYENNKNLNVINETKSDLMYSTDKNKNPKHLFDTDKNNHGEYAGLISKPYVKYNLLENKNDLKSSDKNPYDLNKNNLNNKYKPSTNSDTRKRSGSKGATVNNLNNDKMNSFLTNKYSNFNNNFLNEIADETILSITNDINIFQNNILNDKNDSNEGGSFNRITEVVPTFFKNDKLFCNFEIRDKSIKKVNLNYDYGYFGIRCRDPLRTNGGRYYFNVYLQNTYKSNIFIGITSDARMGVPGGYHKSHNTFMYSLINCDAYVRNNTLIGNFIRRGRTGDIYTFFVDFEFKFIKLFLNGNELNHNNINIYDNQENYYPCIDIKDSEDCISFVDRIILNFNN